MGSPVEPSPGPRDETRSESGGGPCPVCGRPIDCCREVDRLRETVDAIEAGTVDKLLAQISASWAESSRRVERLGAEVELANHHLERCREGYRLQYEALGVYQREQEELKADRDEKHRALQGTAGRSDRLMRALERIAECYWTDGETMTIDEAQAIARDALDGP